MLTFLSRAWRMRPIWPVIGLILMSYGLTAAAAGNAIWLQIDTQAHVLKVMRGQEVIRVYEDIAVGRFGTSVDKRRYDGTTPLGDFRINRISNDSSFHRFFGFNYPRLEHADRALKRGDIDGRTYLAIRDAIRSNRPPPQETPLGGYLGIHGIGEGDPEIHHSFNWTNGCVALTNEEIDELAQWIRIGTRVIVY